MCPRPLCHVIIIPMKYTTAIFDMDGTILNTAGDLRTALNYALEKSGHRHDFTEDEVRMFFGSGVHTAIERAFEAEHRAGGKTCFDEDEVAETEEIFRPYYQDHCAIETDSYPGVKQMLVRLRRAGIKTAVVSNKPDEAVRSLAKKYFDGLFDCAVGEQEGVRKKPAPDMTMKTLDELATDPVAAVYIGDSEVDMETAANSGLPCISVGWGFRSDEFLKKHGADRIVKTADEVADIILEA